MGGSHELYRDFMDKIDHIDSNSIIISETKLGDPTKKSELIVIHGFSILSAKLFNII